MSTLKRGILTRLHVLLICLGCQLMITRLRHGNQTLLSTFRFVGGLWRSWLTSDNRHLDCHEFHKKLRTPSITVSLGTKRTKSLQSLLTTQRIPQRWQSLMLISHHRLCGPSGRLPMIKILHDFAGCRWAVGDDPYSTTTKSFSKKKGS